MDLNRIIQGDCLEVLKTLPPNSVHLIVTSPPYAMQRKDDYGGIKESDYLEWFLERAKEMRRVLTPNGSFVLNIKEHTKNYIRSTYVLELQLALIKELKFHWIDTYVWVKKNTYPIGIKNSKKLKDGWEPCFHFAKGLDFRPNFDEVKIPLSQSMIERKAMLQKTPKDKLKKIKKAKSGSVFELNIDTNMMNINSAYPSNVMYWAVGDNRKDRVMHSAIFPKELPAFFIKCFTDPNDVVLDPFSGSGQTCIEAKKRGRRYLGIELMENYVRYSEKRLREVQPTLNVF